MMEDKEITPEFDFKAVFEPEDYLYFYAEALSQERTNKEVDLLVSNLELDPSMSILDLACGYGRHAIRLAELGYDITGVDITEGFLEVARNQAREKGLKVDFLHGDMRNLAFAEQFDRILLLFTAFGYFSEEENFKVLENVARALKPGGLFCVDMWNREALLLYMKEFIVVEKGRDLMIDRNSFDSKTNRIINKRIVIRDGQRKDKPFFIRTYDHAEIKELLARAGLSIKKTFGDWEAGPFNNDSMRMIIITEKEEKK